MKQEFGFCPICSAPLSIDGKVIHPKGKDAIVVTVGGSFGGWGGRFNILDLATECCKDCSDIIFATGKKLKEVLDARKDINKPQILIMDNMSEVRDEKQSSNGHPRKILRKLPFFS